MDTARTGWYVPVHPLIGTQTAHYQMVSSIGVVFAPVGGRFRAISAEGEKEEGEEKENLEFGATRDLSSPTRSVARGRFLLPLWDAKGARRATRDGGSKHGALGHSYNSVTAAAIWCFVAYVIVGI
ncbi:hypothetical protein B296_00014470 [Ensete ventricosum]|uniref:Uncharacterized protein n=1 Tax=Ensete ventricosum TaxID=4639 RepID=A0A427A7K7_ENSVE|nr:hypothetical protein B296_00014470 [Ensete ventricosum]